MRTVVLIHIKWLVEWIIGCISRSNLIKFETLIIRHRSDWEYYDQNMHVSILGTPSGLKPLTLFPRTSFSA